MPVSTITANRIQISFSHNPFVIKEIRNLLTNKIISSNTNQTFIIRTPQELFEPTIPTKVRKVQTTKEGVRFILSDETGRYGIELNVSGSLDGIRFHMNVNAPKPIWLVEWRLNGLQLDEVIVPALGGQVLTKDMPAETQISYKYPFWWNAQFVIGAMKQGGIWIRSKDAEPSFKMLRVRRESEGFALTYGFEANAPLKKKHFEAEWFVDAYDGDWRNPVDVHRQWMEQAFQLTPLHLHAHYPNWANDVDFVLEMWGITKERFKPLHTFEVMIKRLKEWRTLHNPKNTLVYLPGFAMHGIDSHAPDYFPSKNLGGDKGFKKLVDVAHAMGYKVMIHTNVLAMTFTHRLYPKFKKHQVIDCFGRPQGWGLDMDGDWLPEPYFAYINPGAKEWGDLMEKVIGDLIRKFKIDGVFLDQTLLAFNVNKGPNFLSGMRNHINRLQRAFPRILFAGEGLHEQVLSVLPFVQIHGIDSIAEVHAMDGIAPWRRAHPVSTYLFGKYTRFTAHLLTKHPSHPLFKLQEKAYADLGVIPALCLYNDSQKMNMPATRAMIKRARQLHQ